MCSKCGGQFVTHPSRRPDLVRGDQVDNYLTYAIEFTAAAAEHPATAGLADFELTTEQYWVLTDEYNEVLAATTHPAPDWHPWHRPVTCPAVWTRRWGRGNIFVITPGHSIDVLEHPTVSTLVQSRTSCSRCVLASTRWAEQPHWPACVNTVNPLCRTTPFAEDAKTRWDWAGIFTDRIVRIVPTRIAPTTINLILRPVIDERWWQEP